MEVRIQGVIVRDDDTEHALRRKRAEGKTLNFRTYVGPGSDASSAEDVLSSTNALCVIVVHPYFLAQRDRDLLAESAYLSCAKICIDDSGSSPDLNKDKHVTLNKRQKNEISNDAKNVTEVPFQDDDMERPVEMCLLETYLLHNVNMDDKDHCRHATHSEMVRTWSWSHVVQWRS